MMMVDKEFVKTNLHSKDITFVDGRPRGMYTGEKPGIMIHTRKEVARRGHLPGAINIPWKSHIDKDSKFLDKNTLKKLYTEKGVVKEKTIVVYCNEGVHAVYNWFVLTKMLDFTNVRGMGVLWVSGQMTLGQASASTHICITYYPCNNGYLSIDK